MLDSPLRRPRSAAKRDGGTFRLWLGHKLSYFKSSDPFCLYYFVSGIASIAPEFPLKSAFKSAFLKHLDDQFPKHAADILVCI